VKDNLGESVIGANVTEKGTTNGMITDLDGNFSLTVQKNATLVISYIGYVTQEIAIKGNTNLNIILKEDSKALEEVVVIGYGTARKSDVTGSIASVGGDKLQEMPSTNITYALQNRVAGVDMAQTSSQPGATMQIRIRGTRSLTASNDPLVVLDGIPFMGNLSDINPGDIKSMDILKDASSTAIYGSRGANGVILITTNRGAQGTPAKFTYNGYVGAKSVFSKYPMMDGPKYAEMRKYAGKFENSLDESDDMNTDWQDLLYRTGMVNSHDVSVAGGTNNGSYSFGAAYYKDQGVIPTQNYTRYSLRGSFDQGVGKYFRFGLTTNSNYNVTKGSNIGLYGVLANSPLANPYNEDGSLKEIQIYGKTYKGRELYDVLEAYVRRAFYAVDREEQRKGRDILWFIWASPSSPLFGKDKMTTFERYFIADKETHKETKGAYYHLLENEKVVDGMIREFGLDPETGHIINGHVPVHQGDGESPVKCNGKVIVIDGGFCKAYQKVTGIAGYTLIYNSYGLVLTAHEPFTSKEQAISKESDIVSNRVSVHYTSKRRLVGDTDTGRALKERIGELRQLLDAYRKGIIKEKK
jgi:TonB-dependent SusC/RagA subfamily outer membrane receptor